MQVSIVLVTPPLNLAYAERNFFDVIILTYSITFNPCKKSSMPTELCASYLKNRTQFVTYDGEKSETKHITCGVPQGSILGPLFLLPI